MNSLVQLIGPDVLCFSSKNINIKPPEIGSVVEWHQDMAYGPVTNRSMLAVLVYLDDADATNGCLQVIPGKMRMLDHSQDGYFQGKVTEPVDVSKAVLIEAPRGTAIFFSGLRTASTRVNTSPRPRRTLILDFRGGRCVSDSYWSEETRRASALCASYTGNPQQSLALTWRQSSFPVIP